MDEFDFGDMSGLDFGDFDLSGLENMDLSGLADIDMSGLDFGDFDLSGLEGLEGLDLSGLEGMDLSSIDLGDLEGLDLNSIAELGIGDFDLNDLDGLDSAGGNTRSLFGGGESGYSPEDQKGLDDLINDRIAKYSGEGGGEKVEKSEKPELTKGGLRSDGLGLRATGRGQLSMRDPETGATGLTAEGFTSLKDLLGSGTAEEIARYTPGSVDYSIRSGLETPEGLGLSSDATRGMGLKAMGGGQGLSLYKPAEYGSSVLEDLVKRMDPEFTGNIQDYVNDEIFNGKGLTPFKGTGGTLSRAGFLNQSSAQNPLGAKYAIGDPNSFINRPSVTGQQATVSPGKTVIDNKDGTTKVVTDKDGKTTTKTVDSKNDGGEKKDDWMKWIMMLMALDAMRNKGGSSGAVIPNLTAGRSTTPYAQVQNAPGYRPGQGGVQYFGPTLYRAAGGGIGALDAAGGRLLRGPGDGVSDDIVAQIGNNQPARLADGEYVLDARTVSEIGNGSTDAGADKIAEMVERIHSERRNAKRGEPSNADKKLLA
jgi:hypothetical protein